MSTALNGEELYNFLNKLYDSYMNAYILSIYQLNSFSIFL
jgi:hypothetical protein